MTLMDGSLLTVVMDVQCESLHCDSVCHSDSVRVINQLLLSRFIKAKSSRHTCSEMLCHPCDPHHIQTHWLWAVLRGCAYLSLVSRRWTADEDRHWMFKWSRFWVHHIISGGPVVGNNILSCTRATDALVQVSVLDTASAYCYVIVFWMV